MNWSLFFLIITASLCATDNEIESLLHSPLIAHQSEAIAFLETLNTPHPPEEEKKCSFKEDPVFSSNKTPSSNPKLLLFTSFSVPLETWKAQSPILEKIGGVFVLRGLPENSFAALSQKIIDLRKAGVHAAIVLDPESFEKYEVDVVPTIILDSGKTADKVVGNISLSSALSIFCDKGSTQTSAQTLLRQLEVR